MANIELYGIEDTTIVINAIKGILEKENFNQDCVITVINSRVISCAKEGGEAPFIRIYSNESKEAELVGRVLGEFGYDIEIILLYKFVPAVREEST